MTPASGLGWRWSDPKGATGRTFPTSTEAAEDALRRALAARWDPKFPAATKSALWRSLKGKGWQVEWVGLEVASS